MLTEPRYYVYLLRYPDGQPFYVGKGSGDRMSGHEREARTGHSTNLHKIGVIQKIWASGGTVIKDKIFLTDHEETAYEVEKLTIKAIGIKNLTNICEGGNGIPGFEARERQRKASSTANAKLWQGFVDPWGREFRNIRNLWDFCEEWGLTYWYMLEVHKGTVDHHKGWRKIGRVSYFDEFHSPTLALARRLAA